MGWNTELMICYWLKYGIYVLLLVGIPSWCAAIGWNSKRKCYAIGWSTKRSCYWLLYREDVMLLVGIPSWWAAIFWNTELMWCYWLEYLVIDTECAAIGGVCAYLLVWTFTVGSYYWFKSGRSAIGWNSENMCTVHCATCISGLVINSCRVAAIGWNLNRPATVDWILKK